ncbi:hypothetical protein, partial [Paraburkholderia sp. XV]|uniref:hypothetical protein n=1 Tax=Paraburkholderia sp. XV TaxID=2831520 RepID=UPI001CD663F9
AKKSRCRPAQGRRLKRAKNSRMPAQKQNTPTSTARKAPRQTQAQAQANHPSVADRKKTKTH